MSLSSFSVKEFGSCLRDHRARKPAHPQNVRDPQGRLTKSFKDGRQHKVRGWCAPLPGVPEVFEIVEAFEFGHSDVKLSLSKEEWDEDDKCYDFTNPVDTKLVDLNLGANVDVGECYAIGPDAKEAFEIVEAFEFGHSEVKLLLSNKKWDEDDKENEKKKKPAPKAIRSDGRKALGCY